MPLKMYLFLDVEGLFVTQMAGLIERHLEAVYSCI